MSEPTSVRPDALETFVSESLASETHYIDRAGHLTANFAAFAAASGVAAGVVEMINSYVEAIGQTRAFAEVLHAAVVAADVSDVDGVATISSAALADALERVAAGAGLDLDAIMGPRSAVEILPPVVGTVVPHSGYVDDPVCTATGHFLEDEVDLVVPARLGPLSWPRRYSSRLLDTGAHGRGWWTWADARVAVDDTTLSLVTHDGRHVTFVTDQPGEWVHTTGADVSARVVADGVEVRWGVRSPDGPQLWAFDPAGRIRSTVDDRTGRVEFDHVDGRLATVRHEGGRSIELVWDTATGRIDALRCNDGREVTYRYDGAGDLLEVRRALGHRTYEPDENGRIVRVTDADGVVLAENRYDLDGRVTRQLAPTGRTTVLRYEPGRITRVLDETGSPIAVYEHDQLGRVERITSPLGPRLTRRFDRHGVVVEQRSDDGAGFETDGGGGPDETLTVRHTDGRVESFRRDHRGRVVEHQSTDQGRTTFVYDGDSSMPSLVERPLGGRLELEHGPSGALSAVTDADGVSLRYDIDAEGLPVAAYDGLGRTSRIERHRSGAPMRIELPDGGTVVAEVDDAGRLLQISDPTGVTTQATYTAAGRLASIAGPMGSFEFDYGEHGHLRAVRAEDGSEIHHRIDDFGRIEQVTDPEGQVWTFEHSVLGVLTRMVLPTGAVWSAQVDSHHRISDLFDPDSRRTAWAHDDVGRVAQVTVASGVQGRLTFDPAGRLESVSGGGRGPQVLVRDARGRVVSASDADDVEERWEWSPADRLVAHTTGDRRYELDYDASGALVAVARGDGRAWRYERDSWGRPLRIVSPEGRQTEIRRDHAGRPLEVDRHGSVTRYRYDDQGRQSAIVRPTGATVSAEHDPLGRLSAVRSPDGAETGFRYDRAGRLVEEIDPAGGSIRFEYDAAGTLVSRTDQLGRTTRYDRDASGLLRAVHHPDGRQLDYDLDSGGRVRSLGDGGSLYARFGYADSGLLDQVHEPGRTRTFGYTDAGRLERWIDDDGADVRWRHRDGRVVSRTGPGLPEAEWTHSDDGVRGHLGDRTVAVEADADGSVRRVAIDDSELILRRDAAGRVVASDLDGRTISLQRDAAGRVVGARTAEASVTYGYDDADRLASMAVDGVRTAWRYDAAGRLIAEITEGRQRAFEYDDAHQLVRVVDGDDVTTFEYDECGRRVAERSVTSTRTFEWDAMGRLTAVLVDGERLDVDIDSFGLLCGVGSHRLRWDHAGPSPVLAAADDDPVLAVGHRVVGIGGAILPSGLLGPAGPLPWGHADESPAPQFDTGLPGGIGFAGLVWLGARIYDPATRQFLSPDPLPGVPGSSASGFPYAYAGSDPLNWCDPTGLTGQPISIDDFNDMRAEATSAGWGNVAKVGLAVAGTVAIVAVASTGVGLVGLMAAGGAIGAAQGAGFAMIDGKPLDEVVYAAGSGFVLGAAGGAFARGVSLVMPSPAGATSAVGAFGRGAGQGTVTGLVDSTASELNNAYGYRGSGEFNPWAVAGGTVLSTVGGGFSGRIEYGRVPTTTTVDVEIATGPAPAASGPVYGPELPPAPSVTPGRELLVIERSLITVDITPSNWIDTGGLVHPSPQLWTPGAGLPTTDSGLYLPTSGG
ncbi:MAG: DUF6531 domain-containing protein [Acidimicrobiales bacterium]